MSTLKELLSGVDKCFVEYRTHLPSGEDVWAGGCFYENGELRPIDQDKYSLDDKFVKYEFSPDKTILTVWYKSKWITG